MSYQLLSERKSRNQQKTSNPKAEQRPCPQCGASTQSDWEICSKCGYGLHADTCSFCGTNLDEKDVFCSECGNPRKGIVCPNCDTLNFRSFCRKCNHALDEMAVLEIGKAQKDPIFKQILALAQELAGLEEQIEKIKPVDEQPQIELSETDKNLIQQYKNLLVGMRSSDGVFPSPLPKTDTETSTETLVKKPSKIQLSLDISSLEGIQQAYKRKLEEMQETMKKLVPDNDMSPQMQRNYYSARKIPAIQKKVTRTLAFWVCNLCGCRHNQPSECSKPELGGNWVYEEITVITKD